MNYSSYCGQRHYTLVAMVLQAESLVHQMSLVLHLSRLHLVLPFTGITSTRIKTSTVAIVLNNVFLLLICAFSINSLWKNVNMLTVEEKPSLKRISIEIVTQITTFMSLLNYLLLIPLSFNNCKFFEMLFHKMSKVYFYFKLKKNRRVAIYRTLGIINFVELFEKNYLIWVFKINNFFRIASDLTVHCLHSIENLILIICIELLYYLIMAHYKLQELRLKKILTEESIENIRQLREGLALVLEVQGSLQRQFGTFLLLSVAHNVLALLTRGIFLFTVLPSICRHVMSQCLGIVLSFAVCLMRFVFITAVCHAVTDQVNRIAQEVTQLLTRQHEPSITRELQILEAVVKSRPAEFSAHRFFTIDLKLLSAAGGAITSYILIITQLQE